MKILIAEDDAVARLILQKMVQKLGHTSLTAQNGTDAWELLQQHSVDVVISDWMMPGMDGLELCRHIRARGGDTYTYVILLTALSDKAHLLTAIQAGADEYLTKPVDHDELQVRLISASRVTSLHSQLAAQKAALEAKTRDQEAFVYSVAHDLRAPLVSLQGLASMLVEDYAQQLDDNAILYVDRISANAHKLHALVNDLLQLLKVGQAQVEYSPIDLGAVVEQVLEQLNHTLQARAAEVQVHGALPTVSANHAQMVQLFTNLIDNGVKYTPPDRTPRVAIEAHGHDDAWRLAISDNGVGIPPALQPKIFGIFQRLPSGKALNPEGTGVGLAIVARIVEAHGGKLWVESAEGMGTTFHVALPKRTALEDGDQKSIFVANVPNNAA